MRYTTVSTSGRRSSSRFGTTNGMWAALIFALARVIRCPTVASLVKKARAISGTVSPATSRRVRAKRASVPSAGWQQVKISRSWSSSTAGVGCGSGWCMRASACLAWRCDSRRSRSMALRDAVVISQPPGLGGIRSRQAVTAARTASPAASSATSRSPKRRASEATTRGHSSRKTSSIISGRSRRERANLDLAPARLGPLGGQFEGDVQVGGVDDPEPTDPLLGLEVRPVGEDRLVARTVDHRGGGRGPEAAGEDEVALGGQLVVEHPGGGHGRLGLLGGPVGAVLAGGRVEVRLLAVHREQVLRHLRPPWPRPRRSPRASGSA